MSQAELEFIREVVGKISTILNRLDEKKESSGNQQSHGLTIEEKEQALAVQTDVWAFARIVWAMRKTEEMSFYDAAVIIQKNFRAHLIRTSEALRAYRELTAFARRDVAIKKAKKISVYNAAAKIQKNFRAYLVRRSQAFRAYKELKTFKAKLKEIRSLCNKLSYRHRIVIDTTERLRLAEKIIILLLTVEEIEAIFIELRAAKKSMVDELQAMLKVVDSEPPENSLQNV